MVPSKTLVGDPITGKPRLRAAPRIPRTVANVKYNFIDFGHAKKYSRADDAPEPSSYGRLGHQKHRAPEEDDGRFHNPMPADVYKLGAMFKDLYEVSSG